MAKNRVLVSLAGDRRDQGHVRLNDFLKQLDSVREALQHTAAWDSCLNSSRLLRSLTTK